jgi:cell division protease FtsH
MKSPIQKPKRPLMFYYSLVLLVMFVFNLVVMPFMMKQQITTIEYSTFLTMVDEGKISTVILEDTRIYLEGVEDADGKKPLYETGYIYDPDLVARLSANKSIKFYSEIPEEVSPILEFIVTWVLPIAIFVALGQFLSKQMTKRMGGGAMSFGKSNAKIYVEAQTGKTFEDVAGQDEAKDSLCEVVDFLHNPLKYSSVGARVPKGVLLVGPPGTGKTLIAKAVAGEAGVPFFSITGSEFVEMFVGMGAARVRDLFKQAQEKAPCIVFIDEIDTIGKRRDSMGFGGNDEREQTLNQLLSEMDGFDSSKGVIILAATNRPEILDKALLRPGRFDRRIPVELPDLKGREAILKVHLRGIKTDSEIDFSSLARSTPGASGADLANIINEAALRAVRNDRKLVTQADLDEAVETTLAGEQRKNAVISPREKKIIATHEIGHAIVAAFADKQQLVHKITIVPRTSGALGYTMQLPEEERVLMSKTDALSRITVLTGGRAAEEVMFNEVTSGAANDIEQATRLARAMVTRMGMSDNFGMMALETVNNPYLGGDSSMACSGETASTIDEEVKQIIRTCQENARKILRENHDKLVELTEFLLEKETITGKQFLDMMGIESEEKPVVE